MQNQNPSDDKEKESLSLKQLFFETKDLSDPLPPVNKLVSQDFDFSIPSRFENCSFENYQPQGVPESSAFVSQSIAFMFCKNLVREFPDTKFGFLLAGNCGVGKTHLAVATLKEILLKTRLPGAFVDCGSLLRNIRDSYKKTSSWESKVLDPLYESEVVLLDNLGLINQSAWAMETLTIFINTFYNKNRLLIATTNFLDTSSDSHTLTEAVGISVRSRLFQMGKYLRIDGEDYRKKSSPSFY